MVKIVNYPAAQELWLSPWENEENYAVAYSEDLDGTEIFTDDKEAKAKTELAAGIALEYLEAAGYRIENRKAVEAPEGASLQYTVWLADGKDNPLYPVIEQAKETLGGIGITLKIREIDGDELLQEPIFPSRNFPRRSRKSCGQVHSRYGQAAGRLRIWIWMHGTGHRRILIYLG